MPKASSLRQTAAMNEGTAAHAALLGLSPEVVLRHLVDSAIRDTNDNPAETKELVFLSVYADINIIRVLVGSYVEKRRAENASDAGVTLGKRSHEARAARPKVVPKAPSKAALKARLRAADQKASILESLKLSNGIALGDNTLTTLRELIEHHAIETGLARMIIKHCGNAPPNEPIRNFIKADQAKALYEKAKSYAADLP